MEVIRIKSHDYYHITLYRACQKRAPWRNEIIKNISHKCLKNTRYVVSPISSPSNALHHIKFDCLIPEILSMQWQQCNLPSGHFLALIGYLVEKEFFGKFLCYWFNIGMLSIILVIVVLYHSYYYNLKTGLECKHSCQ